MALTAPQRIANEATGLLHDFVRAHGSDIPLTALQWQPSKSALDSPEYLDNLLQLLDRSLMYLSVSETIFWEDLERVPNDIAEYPAEVIYIAPATAHQLVLQVLRISVEGCEAVTRDKRCSEIVLTDAHVCITPVGRVGEEVPMAEFIVDLAIAGTGTFQRRGLPNQITPGDSVLLRLL